LDCIGIAERIGICAARPFAGKLVRNYGDEPSLSHLVGDCPCPIAYTLIVGGHNDNRSPIRPLRTHDKGQDSVCPQGRSDPFDMAGSGAENMPGIGRGW
jgi:hypothetical protein